MKNLPGKLTVLTITVLIIVSFSFVACSGPKCSMTGEINKAGGKGRLANKKEMAEVKKAKEKSMAEKIKDEVEVKKKALAEAEAKLAKLEADVARKLAEEQAKAKHLAEIAKRTKEAADTKAKKKELGTKPVTPLSPPAPLPSVKSPVKVAAPSAEQIGYCAKTNHLVQWYDYSVRWVSTNEIGQSDGIYLLDEPNGSVRMFHLSDTNLVVGKIYRWDGTKFRQLAVK